MKLNILNLTAAALTAVTLAAPASAQDRERHRSEGDNRGRSAERAQPRTESRQDRQENRAQPRTESRQDRQENRAQPRAEVVAPHVAPLPRAEVVAPRVEGRAVPRGSVVAPRYDARPNYSHDYRGDYRPNYSYRPSYGYRGYGYSTYRPYVFRPRFRLGFGIFVGYPVTYSYAYPYPVPVYGYGAPAAPVVIGPNSSYYGGIALEISPDDGAVFVDGVYAGVVRDFDGTDQPLTLSGGTHRIQITAPGYEPLSFEVQAQPGQVIPYQGQMQPY